EISSRCHSIDAGHQCGAPAHQDGGASTAATQLALVWVMYCSMPKNANGMVSSPSTTPAIQPEVFSRSFESMAIWRCGEAGQFKRKRPASLRALRVSSGVSLPAMAFDGGVDGTRTRDLRRDRPAF